MYFHYFFLMNDSVFPVQLISFLFSKHLLVVKNSKFKNHDFIIDPARRYAIFDQNGLFSYCCYGPLLIITKL